MCKICAFSQTKTTKRQKFYTGRRSRYISWTVFGIDHLLLGRCFFKFSSQKKAGQAFYLSNDPPTSPTKKNPFNNKKTCKDSFWKPTKQKKYPTKTRRVSKTRWLVVFVSPTVSVHGVSGREGNLSERWGFDTRSYPPPKFRSCQASRFSERGGVGLGGGVDVT